MVSAVSPGAEAPGAGSSVELKFVTYNIAGLPEPVTSDRSFLPVEQRFRLIAARLRSYDIVCLQEAFIREREIIEKILGAYFVAHGVDTMRQVTVGSGLYIFSRSQIIRSHFEAWRESEGWDARSLKGFIGATVRVSSKSENSGAGFQPVNAFDLEIDVYTLHAQAGNADIRLRQYKQLIEGLKLFSIGRGRPIIVTGDFNCELDERECKWILENTPLKVITFPGDDIDHFFYFNNDSGWSVSAVKIDNMPQEDWGGKRLSDHLPVEAVLRFEKE